jgi:hypothetical protein
MKIPKYPIIMKNDKLGQMEIIYHNKIELYHIDFRATKSEIDREHRGNWTPQGEIDMLRGSGFRFVNTELEEIL